MLKFSDQLRRWAKKVNERTDDTDWVHENEIFCSILETEKDKCGFKLSRIDRASKHDSYSDDDICAEDARIRITLCQQGKPLEFDYFYINFERSPKHKGLYVSFINIEEYALVSDIVKNVWDLICKHYDEIVYVFFENEFIMKDQTIECVRCDKSFPFDKEKWCFVGCQSEINVCCNNCILDTPDQEYVFTNIFFKGRILEDFDDIRDQHPWFTGCHKEPVCDQCIKEMIFYGEIIPSLYMRCMKKN